MTTEEYKTAANIFFYRKGNTTIMIDAGYNYDRLAEKMEWLGIEPAFIRHILITHQDTDHIGAVEADSPGLFQKARLYIGEVENRYLTGEVRRRVFYHLYKLPPVTPVGRTISILPLHTGTSSARRLRKSHTTHSHLMMLTMNPMIRKKMQKAYI